MPRRRRLLDSKPKAAARNVAYPGAIFRSSCDYAGSFAELEEKRHGMDSWSAGASVGPYVLIGLIGAGGMGEVWKARDSRLERIVAIKRLKVPHLTRFEQEARAIASLNHTNICPIDDVGPDYLVLEFVDGTPLRCPCSSNEALRLAEQIVSALEAAHARNIVHRDLSRRASWSRPKVSSSCSTSASPACRRTMTRV